METPGDAHGAGTTGSERIAVVVVTYESASVLPGFVDALEGGLRGVDHEVVVVDNDSTDGSPELAQRLMPDATVVRTGGNFGYAYGIEAGRAAAGGHDALLVLNPDVRLDEGAARELLDVMARTGAGVAVPRLRSEDGTTAWSLRREPTMGRAWAEALLGGNRAGRLGLGELVVDPARYARVTSADWATGAALLVSSGCRDDVGSWDLGFFLYSEETDFCLRARDAGHSTVLAPSAGAVHIGGQAPTSPRLWSLLVANRVKLARKRHGRLRAAGTWSALVVGSALRAARGDATHRAALRGLFAGVDRAAPPEPPDEVASRATRVAPAMRDRVRPRHVVIIVQNLPVPLDRRVWLEARALVEDGFRVSVICPKGPGDLSFEVLDDVRIHKYAPAPQASGVVGFAVEFAYCWLRTAGKLVRVAASGRVDAIQACNPPDTYFALAAPLTLVGTRFVFDQHDLSPEIYRVRFGRDDGLLLEALLLLERLTYRLADRVIATNTSYRTIAIERGGVSPDDVTVVRNGPDLKRLRPVEPQPELREGRRYLCCYLGIMGPQDGVDMVVRAAKVVVEDLGRDDVTFALLGFGDCLEDLRRLTADLGLEDRVRFTGRADDRMIAAYLSTADVGLSPDPMNPFNDASTMNKTMEYMAFGLPVVAFDLTETRVSAGEAGVYVSEDDAFGYAKAVVDLLDDEERRERMGQFGLQRVHGELEWSRQVPEYVQMYRELLDPSGR